VGMLSDLYDAHEIIRETFNEANQALGFDLWDMVRNGPADDLNQTHNTQPAMLTSGLAVWRLMQHANISQPRALAGHSLGEYTALVAAGAMDFADAVSLVALRGKLMQEAVPAGEGAMAAILGLDDDVVRSLCNDAAQGMVVEAVNFNSPGQVVIAGNTAAVERAMAAAKQAGAKRALALPVSAPSHCALMQPAAEKLAEQLSAISMTAPSIPVIHNVNVAATNNPDEIKRLLAEQLYSPVRWVETINSMHADGITKVVEAGPGKVLTGLCKRINKEVSGLGVFDQNSFEKFLEDHNA